MKQRNLFTVLLGLLLCLSAQTKAQLSNPFVTLWDTQYLPSGQSLVIPGEGEFVKYYWEKVGSESTVNSGNDYKFYHNYNDRIDIPDIKSNSGLYRMYIINDFNHIIMANNVSSAKALIAVESWGDLKWKSFEKAFQGCSNLTSLPIEAPSQIYTYSNMNFSYMLSGASAFNQNIGGWSVGGVTDMSYMFDGASSFNQNIENWNVSEVTKMNGMFRNASSFNQNVGNWDVGNVMYMNSMFSGASAFNQDIGNWNVAKVIEMSSMFQNASSFNQNIGSWNVAKVTKMGYMFSGATSFNQNIGNWTVWFVTNMQYMFSGATSFNQNIGNWGIFNTTDMSYMFSSATSFNQVISSNWNVAKVTSMKGMFQNAIAFNQNLGGLKLNSSLNMVDMLNNSGLDSQNYGLSLKGWAENSNTPISRTLGSQGLKYALEYKIYRDKLTDIIVRGFNWTINDAGVDNTLPVNIISFTAKVESNIAKLQWQTANETNHKGFEIYRSSDDGVFVKLGDVSGSNGSSYIYTDKQPLNGNNYYKLVQVDNDGTATELGVKVLNFSLQLSALNLYPNPAHNRLSIRVAQSQEIFKIYNAQGKIVVQQVFNQTQNSVDITSLPAGLYFYSYGSEQGKFVKQ